MKVSRSKKLAALFSKPWVMITVVFGPIAIPILFVAIGSMIEETTGNASAKAWLYSLIIQYVGWILITLVGVIFCGYNLIKSSSAGAFGRGVLLVFFLLFLFGGFQSSKGIIASSRDLGNLSPNDWSRESGIVAKATFKSGRNSCHCYMFRLGASQFTLPEGVEVFNGQMLTIEYLPHTKRPTRVFSGRNSIYNSTHE